jgi:hypothetical protein
MFARETVVSLPCHSVSDNAHGLVYNCLSDSESGRAGVPASRAIWQLASILFGV